MRTVRAFEVLSFVVPLALAACGGDKNREAQSPSNTAEYEAPAPSNTTGSAQEPSMTPASRIDDQEEMKDSTGNPPREWPSDTAKSSALSDEQIAAIADAANTGEIDAAKYALTKTKNQRVRKFAQMMIDEHGKAKQNQSKLLSRLGMTPAESTKLRDLKTSSSDTDRTLKAAPDDMFDKVYIDIQVADHQLVLDSLDREFIPSVQNPELKKSLEDFRPKVQAHLDEALAIQKSLMGAPGSKAGSSTKSGTKSGAQGTPGNGNSGNSGTHGTSGSGTTGSEGSSNSGSSNSPSGGSKQPYNR